MVWDKAMACAPALRIQLSSFGRSTRADFRRFTAGQGPCHRPHHARSIVAVAGATG
jgi:hypothetical protein